MEESLAKKPRERLNEKHGFLFHFSEIQEGFPKIYRKLTSSLRTEI